MSIRARLLLTVVGLLVLGLGGAAGATFGAVQDWGDDGNDQVLSTVGRAVQSDLADGGTLELPSTQDAAGAVWQATAEQRDIPSFFQIRDSAGRVVQTAPFTTPPRLADPLPAPLRPGPATADNADGERFHSADGWLIRSAWLPDGRMLLVGMPTAEYDELTGRTATAVILSAVTALVAVTALATIAIRRGLRPLDRIADTASAIGAGDLDRRVTPARPDTEVGRLGLALNAMLGQLESAFTERRAATDRLRRFVADASHELRTPIATIRGYAELFRRGAAVRPDDLTKSMRRIESEAARMGELVDEMLLLARLDEGRPLARDPVDLTELARDAVADAGARQSHRPLHLTADTPVVVEGDGARLRQVIGNLLANVVQHTPADTPAEVRVSGVDGRAVVEVVDHGPGIDEAHADRVFERFHRGARDGRRDEAGPDGERGGAGLGLAIVAAVAEAHGGRAEVEPTPGGGATFRVSLPMAD